MDLSKTLKEALSALFHRNAHSPNHRDAEKNDFWALKDITFDVERGEKLGIIGANGAGKSTLLKLLCRITTPTTGYADIYGRVGALLEVGTGFHPELTGRENIFLNGSVLGMTAGETRKKFDEIVAFSGVERFLDTPIKRYSSGMRVRLGFAVAAHLEPEILIVDEVLAVGDSKFRKACLNKMNDVSKEGRTVLFVSHNMQAINTLCNRCLLLEEGRIVKDGQTEEVVKEYLQSENPQQLMGCVSFPEDKDKPHQIESIRLTLDNGEIVNRPITTDESFFITINYVHRKQNATHLYASFYLSDEHNQVVLFSDSRDVWTKESIGSCFNDNTEKPIPISETFSIRVSFPLLAPGRYFISAGLASENGKLQDEVVNVLQLDIIDITGVRTQRPGFLSIPCKWEKRR